MPSATTSRPSEPPRRTIVSKKAVSTESADTIADGIAVREPVQYAVESMRDTVHEVVSVSEDSIVRAMRLAHFHLGVVIEPAGVVGLAAVLEHSTRWRGTRVGIPLCGGNVTQEDARRWLFGGSASGARKRVKP